MFLILTAHFTEVLLDEEVRYCLFLAACKGGHLNLIKKWYAPGTNVNQQVAYVTGFYDCEDEIPLFVACQGMIQIFSNNNMIIYM